MSTNATFEGPVPGVPDEVQDCVVAWLNADREASPDDGSESADLPEERNYLDAAREMAVFIGLPDDQRKLVSDRLLAFWNYRNDPTSTTVSGLAKTVKTGRANVYRLMERMSEIGPIRGLVPQYRAKGRASNARDGFGEPWDAWIAEALGSDPGMSIANIGRRLDEMRRADKDLISSQPPSPTALKGRIKHLRRTPSTPMERTPIGRRLLIDSCRINVSIFEPRKRSWWITCVVDLDTGIVCGLGLYNEFDGDGIVAALSDMRRRLPDMAREVAMTDRIADVEWVVPNGMLAAAEKAGTALPASRRPRIELISRSEARPGVRLVRLIGDRIGAHRLITRTSLWRPTAKSKPSLDDLPIEEAIEQGYFASNNMQEASFALETAVSLRNGQILAGLPRLGSRGREAALRNAEALTADLVTLMSTVVRDDDGGLTT